MQPNFSGFSGEQAFFAEFGGDSDSFRVNHAQIVAVISMQKAFFAQKMLSETSLRASSGRIFF
jgi:hypothetical protein